MTMQLLDGGSGAAPLENSYWLPGDRILAGGYPGAAEDAVCRDRIRRLLDAGVRAFVDLTVPGEGGRRYDDLLLAEAHARDVCVSYHRTPVADSDRPPCEAITRMLELLDALVEQGQVVYLHCWGGTGRTGTIVSCYLVRHGWSGGEAMVDVARRFRGNGKAE